MSQDRRERRGVVLGFWAVAGGGGFPGEAPAASITPFFVPLARFFRPATRLRLSSSFALRVDLRD